MNLDKIFISKVKFGGTRLLFRKKYFYDVDRYEHIYIDLNTNECFSFMDLRGELIPFTTIYDKGKHLSKRKILKKYNEKINEFN